MSIQSTPRGLRLQIGFFGRRNTGKSSLLNALVQQNAVIVSDVPGTTTDPVEKAMELSPLGPVLLIDTAGIDDDQATIGALRAERSLQITGRCDLALLVTDTPEYGNYEKELLERFEKAGIPYIKVLNKCDTQDCGTPDGMLKVSAKTGQGMSELRAKIAELAPDGYFESSRMLGDLIEPGDAVLFVTPIDKAAPKGRLIMPQVQAIRDTLDSNAYCLAATVETLEGVLNNLKTPPALAVTDSQVFGQVSKIVPETIPLTSFSILMARLKGDLAECAAGAAKIGKLHNGSRILIAEACAHHPAEEDIGRVKLPRWIREYTGLEPEFDFAAGAEFPADLTAYDLVIHCGACTFNRRAVISRMLHCREQGVPFTNYGVAIAYVHGILERTLKPFSGAYAAYQEANEKS